MITLRYLVLYTFVILGIQSCNGPRSKDSVSVAKQENDVKDTTNMDETILGTEEFPTMATQPYSDSDFAVDAEDQNMLEIELGKLSLTNSSNQNVKDFGQMMINDHTKANDQLMAIAKQKDFVLPHSLSQKSLKHIKDLSNKMGKEFDKHYIHFMISDDRRIISIFENASLHASDSDIKEFATNTLPTLIKHLATAKALKDKL